RFSFRTDCIVMKTFLFYLESRSKGRHPTGNPLRRFFGAGPTRSTTAPFFMRAQSGPIRACPTLFSNKPPPAIALLIKNSCAVARPRNLCGPPVVMHPDTLKKLQDIGAFVLASNCTKKSIKQVAEMIRAARDYRWVAIYKIVKDEFVI